MLEFIRMQAKMQLNRLRQSVGPFHLSSVELRTRTRMPGWLLTELSLGSNRLGLPLLPMERARSLFSWVVMSLVLFDSSVVRV